MKYPIDQPFSLTVEEVAKLVQADTAEGITYYEAKKRSRVYGLNSYKTQKQKSLWLILLYQFKNPIVYLLIAGSLASLYFKDILETTAILAVILINALIGFFMEFQARNSMNALKKWI
ncbi:cation-transporting P-type ATPase [Mucilaginibacter sp. P25]|uniref:cation-transporting P-type ATPase n=1 Tax=unclassified Mucilaginibacter TaxID=2617802 RepID=UPI003D66D19E